MPDITTINYNGKQFQYDTSKNWYVANDGSYIGMDYKVFNASGNQIGQYYPPLAAAPNISWVIPALLIAGFYIYVFRKDLKLVK